MIKLIRFIDKWIGKLLLLFLKQNKKLVRTKKVLIVRLWTLGESLLTLPMIKKLHDEGYQVDVLATDRAMPVFQSCEFISKIINIKSLNVLSMYDKYDVVIDTEPYSCISAIFSWYLGKSSIGWDNRNYSIKMKYDDEIHTAQNMARLIQPLGIYFKPEELISLKYKKSEKIDKLLAPMKGKIIGIHAGTAESSPWRAWKKFSELINLLDEEVSVILTGAPNENKLNEKIIKATTRKNVFNFAGKTNLNDFTYLTTKIDCFVSSDTGPMHLAAAMGCPTIGLFGPNLPVRFKPLNNKSKHIYEGKTLLCSPCINVHKGEFIDCPINGKCMDLISVNQVKKAVEDLLK